MDTSSLKTALESSKSSNQQLDTILEKIDIARQSAKTAEDINRIASEIEHFAQTGDFQYKHTHLLIFFIISALVALIFWVTGQADIIRDDTSTISSLVALATGLFVFAIGFSQNRNKVLKVSKALLLKSTLIDNNLESAAFNGSLLWKELKQDFPDFRRGDESQYIDELYEGRFDGEVIQFKYRLYSFHYVDVETRTYTEYNSSSELHETKTETVRHTRYRYGILMDFPCGSDFCLSTTGLKPYKFKWKTTNRLLNRKLAMTASNELTLAKLLQPAVVLKFEQSLLGFKQPCLQVQGQGRLCLSVSSNRILPSTHSISLSLGNKFIEVLRGDKQNNELNELVSNIAVITAFNTNKYSA
ncbi:hypothetical protein [Alkalimarinus alittae]|uniref:DUF3137 domain-containing protein n=1 Tax=Alkalimarinus alittae TaxID=2961619 RepID=A0ABY6N719_9ALTE|nr:hypothetical protein [Alkalimarinus alittae]UZE97916.1 hypothetical protein NKI27_09340 [Alkalimarinus alittae]